MGKGKLIIHPEGAPFPPGHPFATARIFFGVRRQEFYGENSNEPEKPGPTPTSSETESETPKAGMDDPAWMERARDKMFQAADAYHAQRLRPKKDTESR